MSLIKITAIRLAAYCATPLLFLSCASYEPNVAITQMEQRYVRVSTLPGVQAESGSRLADARAAIENSQMADRDGEIELVNHELLVAGKTLDIVEKQAQLSSTTDQIESASERRQALLLQDRERDAEEAQRRADSSAAALAATNTTLDQRNQQLSQAQQQVERASDALQSQNRELIEIEDRLAQRDQQIDTLQSQAEQLTSDLQDLQMETTERGTVLTLSDIVFDFASADLKSGSERTIDRIADFLQENDGRQIVIEGFTDSIGESDYNQDLSEQRASAVRAALTERGVDESRIKFQGFGEDYPVATNDSPAGRQANRRVEIIVGDDIGTEVSAR